MKFIQGIRVCSADSVIDMVMINPTVSEECDRRLAEVVGEMRGDKGAQTQALFGVCRDLLVLYFKFCYDPPNSVEVELQLWVRVEGDEWSKEIKQLFFDTCINLADLHRNFSYDPSNNAGRI